MEELYKWLPAGLWPDPDSDEENDMFYDAFVNPELTREHRLKARDEWLEYVATHYEIELEYLRNWCGEK